MHREDDMHIGDITMIGWLHTVACVLAFFAGAHNLVAEKGTPRHRLVGRTYFWSMIVLNLTSLTVYRFDIASFRPFVAGPSVFGVFHWLAVITLCFVLLGRFAAARQNRAIWAYTHPIAMTLSYYILIGGAINEAFARLDALHALALHSMHATNGNAVGAPLIGLTHSAAMAGAFIIILYFTAKVALYRRAQRA
jgi:uncharacterized membrane protein